MTVLPYVPVGIITVFFNFRFFNRNSQSQKKLAKKITYFTISFRSKNFTYFKKFNSLDIEKNIAKQTQHSQIPFSLYKFYGKQVSGWCQKKTFGLHQFLDAQELHSRSTMKANVCVFLYISVRTFLFERLRKLLSGERGRGGEVGKGGGVRKADGGGGWTISLRWFTAWAS